jgi:hypothetical protein
MDFQKYYLPWVWFRAKITFHRKPSIYHEETNARHPAQGEKHKQ